MFFYKLQLLLYLERIYGDILASRHYARTVLLLKSRHKVPDFKKLTIHYKFILTFKIYLKYKIENNLCGNCFNELCQVTDPIFSVIFIMDSGLPEQANLSPPSLKMSFLHLC